MRILHVAETVKGGIASYLDELIPDQSRRFGADNIRLLVPDNQAGELDRVARDLILTFRSTRLHRIIHVATLGVAFREAVRNFRPEIVHIHSSVAGISCRFGLRASDAKLIYCAHGWGFARRRSTLSNATVGWIERILSARSHAIICLSKRDFDLAVRHGIHAAKLHVIPNGIADTPSPRVEATGPEHAWPAQRVRVLFVGRFDFQKGFDTFAEAMSHLGSTHHAIAIGMPVVDGALPAAIPSNVDVIGWQPRATVHRYMGSADVVVMPSRWEGAPITVLEAMREGTAVIGSRVGAIPEQIADRCNGILIEPDSPAQLAVELALHKPHEFGTMGKAGYERFRELFAGDRMIASTQRLYAKVVQAAFDVPASRAVYAGELSPSPTAGRKDVR